MVKEKDEIRERGLPISDICEEFCKERCVSCVNKEK